MNSQVRTRKDAAKKESEMRPYLYCQNRHGQCSQKLKTRKMMSSSNMHQYMKDVIHIHVIHAVSKTIRLNQISHGYQKKISPVPSTP
jgi:hypothetical protein